jgi:flagellar biosynthesis protein FlhF
MNVKRFTARNSREALALVKAAFGDDAVVMSTRPCEEGVEVVAMAPESIEQLERVGQTAENFAPMHAPQAQPPAPRQQTLREKLAGSAAPAAAAAGAPARGRAVDRLISRPSERAERTEPRMDPVVEEDIEQLQMSTLSFQDYVRERMLKRRSAERASEAQQAAADHAEQAEHARQPAPVAQPKVVAPIEAARARHTARREVPVLRDEVMPPAPRPAPSVTPPNSGEQIEVMTELRSMRGLIEQRFGALAFMEKLQRHPRQANLARRLLDAGFSPMLIRKLVESLPAEGDEASWAASVLERNVMTGEHDAPLEDQGGIFTLIGATGVGKTTSTAKLAAAFATRHGAPHLGLITLDAYRVGAHEQLRAYGRILGVPVHTAHDRDSLEDLLDLLSAKRMVLIDTAGMAQRDSRTRELLDMLSHKAINRLLVVNASAQGETIEDQLAAYGAPSCKGLILSKLDEAVKLGPALDSMIRHKLKVLAVANGQRVPEDWHRLSAQALVQRALKSVGGPAWQLDERDVNLIFSGLPPAATLDAAAHA